MQKAASCVLSVSLLLKILGNQNRHPRGLLSEVHRDVIFRSVSLKKILELQKFAEIDNTRLRALIPGLLLQTKIGFDIIRPNIRNDFGKRSLATCKRRRQGALNWKRVFLVRCAVGNH